VAIFEFVVRDYHSFCEAAVDFWNFPYKSARRKVPTCVGPAWRTRPHAMMPVGI
jgi:hypothetical protein